MAINQGPSIQTSPWLDRERADILDCLGGIIHNDRPLFEQGWVSLLRGSNVRVLGGLAYAINTLLRHIYTSNPEQFDDPELFVSFVDDAVSNLAMRSDITPETIRSTIDFSVEINTEWSWQQMLIDPPLTMRNMLITYLVLATHVANQSGGIDVIEFAQKHLNSCEAPDVNSLPSNF